MRDRFVMTKNAKRFYGAIERIHHKLKGVERMCLVYGDPGLGKTETALHYAAGNGAVMIRTKKLMTARWFLSELVEELGGAPSWGTKDLFEQARQLLSTGKRTVIFDEVDYFTSDSKVIETLRDLHDLAHCPIVLIGMKDAEKRLKRYPHLMDRFVEIVRFEPLDRDDVSTMIADLSEVKFDDEAIERIAKESDGRIRRILAMIHRAEYVARAQGLKTIPAGAVR